MAQWPVTDTLLPPWPSVDSVFPKPILIQAARTIEHRLCTRSFELRLSSMARGLAVGAVGRHWEASRGGAERSSSSLNKGTGCSFFASDTCGKELAWGGFLLGSYEEIPGLPEIWVLRVSQIANKLPSE